MPVIPPPPANPTAPSTTPNGEFTVWVDGAPQPRATRQQAGELRALLGLRDAVLELLDAEAATADATGDDVDTSGAKALRAALNRRYDTYLATFGPINRFDWSSHTTKAGQVVERKIRPGRGGFRQDPHAATRCARWRSSTR